jgi:hypothetical protein
MTQLRRCKCGISNYFDTVLAGIGHRGSSFSDIDAVSHDGKTGRFLLQEFKREGEPLDPAQHWMLQELAALPRHFTVWHVVKRDDGQIGFAVFSHALEVIPVQEYQRRFQCWWNNVPIVRPLAELTDAELDAEIAARDAMGALR